MAERKCKGLIAFDMDGTVLADRMTLHISPRVTAAFAAAHEAGYELSVSSGRPNSALPEGLLDESWLNWSISSSGALVTDLRTGERLVDSLLSYDLIVQVKELLGSVAKTYWADSPYGFYMETGGDEIFDMSDAAFEVHRVDSLLNAPEMKEGILKLMVHFEDAAAREQGEKLLESMGDSIVAASEMETSIEVSAKGITKAQGALAICERLGVRPEDSVSFGDSGNDASYIDSPITFVVMESAPEQLKAQADAVCPDVYHDGVAVWLEEHIL